MFNLGRSMFNVRHMSAPLSRKNLAAYPTPDDILNAFLDYLSNTNTDPYDHQEEASAGISVELIAHLGEVELCQMRCWNPQRIADMIFNYWD
jgi:hypothetical protein